MPASLSIRKGATRLQAPVVAAILHAARNQPEIMLALFYCSPHNALPVLGRAMRQRLDEIPLCACTTAAEIIACTPNVVGEHALCLAANMDHFYPALFSHTRCRTCSASGAVTLSQVN